ncbi:ROK family transcriptional regulator [Cesiribacter andamanensis]|uniref:MarR family protein n=1 Tax=Cesiribacter andamanensis AMV16 TaxID=1279009 RepID=M7N5J5_9BACT|nr:helix-turn-helix domain-containing protein [Cesiribacter andamanensis]EMR02562.1 MarR family protein [Cesiribacter andamanensis AMV16]
MTRTFFEELSNESATGVAYKNVNLKKRVLSYFANVGNATIAEFCKELNLSPPKVNSLLNELMQDGLVQEQGKEGSSGGRRPNLYGLRPDSGFFLGIDVKQQHINIGLTDFQKNLVRLVERHPYELRNDKESLDELCRLINHFIKEFGIPKEKILGIGINLSGRINHTTGYSYSFFIFMKTP